MSDERGSMFDMWVNPPAVPEPSGTEPTCSYCADRDAELRVATDAEDGGYLATSAREYAYEHGHWPSCPSQSAAPEPETRTEDGPFAPYTPAERALLGMAQDRPARGEQPEPSVPVERERCDWCGRLRVSPVPAPGTRDSFFIATPGGDRVRETCIDGAHAIVQEARAMLAPTPSDAGRGLCVHGRIDGTECRDCDREAAAVPAPDAGEGVRERFLAAVLGDSALSHSARTRAIRHFETALAAVTTPASPAVEREPEVERERLLGLAYVYLGAGDHDGSHGAGCVRCEWRVRYERLRAPTNPGEPSDG